MNTLSRNMRRRLERRGDAALARLGRTVVADPDNAIALVYGDAVRILSADLAAFALCAMGLSNVVAEIENERPRRPNTLPTVVITDGWASVAFVCLQRMSKGGEA